MAGGRRTLRLDNLHEGRPYDPFREALYTPRELLAPSVSEPSRSLDEAIFDHYARTGGTYPDLLESLARRIHDHSIEEALLEVIGRDSAQRTRIVGIMGGHAVPRSDPWYGKVARIAFGLRAGGYRVITGGGPGIMEAANLGAYLAGGFGEGELEAALDRLGHAPSPPAGKGWAADREGVKAYEAYQEAARAVLESHPRPPTVAPQEVMNLAVPTWFYGWEPTNLFADRVAKFFSNSLREDGLLSVSVGGVVFAPGSLGTLQEIFMDAAQNHYETFGYVSPMVFLGRERYGPGTAIGALIAHVSAGTPWGSRTAVLDEPPEVVAFLTAHPPLAGSS
jgi:predicted Rossmann-fold nucleotide-binding protein